MIDRVYDYVAVPIGMYRIVAKQTVVERLRECEN